MKFVIVTLDVPLQKGATSANKTRITQSNQLAN